MDPASTPAAVPATEWPNIDHLVTEDDTPVDNLLSEKQQRLLTEPLYSSRAAWANGRSFLATANVGLFYAADKPPFVPDVLLSLDVEAPDDFGPKRNRSYFVWIFGKLPEVVIEIVSNQEGGEATDKLESYARIGIPYYIIYDPFRLLSDEELRVYGLREGRYEPVAAEWLPGIGLGLMLWQGKFEGKHERWLRWCDHNGQPLPTGAELAGQERQRAEQERQRAEQERQRAEEEHQRAEQERQRAEEEHQRAEEEHQRAEQEQQRAEQERQRAEQASLQTNQERQRTAQAQQRAEQERLRAEQLAAQLRALGIEPGA